ncbi:MAG TPA: hypothetical protein VNB29_05685 [Chthoniobacterales bacterium]|jgi:hypothetical protein|nr:hypothetical protein [Chthoniobacterales bacterium]
MLLRALNTERLDLRAFQPPADRESSAPNLVTLGWRFASIETTDHQWIVTGTKGAIEIEACATHLGTAFNEVEVAAHVEEGILKMTSREPFRSDETFAA